MKYQKEVSLLARQRRNSVAGRARFESHVSRIGRLVHPLVVDAMTRARWPEWFAQQMQQHGPTLMAEEADSLARQVLTYREQLEWLLPDVDPAVSNRHAAEHVARARGYRDNQALFLRLEEGLGSVAAATATACGPVLSQGQLPTGLAGETNCATTLEAD